TSADAVAVPPLPLLSVLLLVFGSVSFAVTPAALSNAPAAAIVADTLIVFLLATPTANEAELHGRALQAPPTVPRARCAGVSLTCTFVAVDGPLLMPTIV